MRAAARQAASEFGYTRMWSIHPNQIRPILEAFAPDERQIQIGYKNHRCRRRARIGRRSASTAHCMTARATVISGRCWSARTPPAARCRPRRKRGLPHRRLLNTQPLRRKATHEEDRTDRRRRPGTAAAPRSALAAGADAGQAARQGRGRQEPAKTAARRWRPSAVIKKPSKKPRPSAKTTRRRAQSEPTWPSPRRVYVGTIQCELGASVNDRRPIPRSRASSSSRTATTKYRMHPVESRTGAIRLEDPRAGAMWLQLGNKSMLMNQKLGLRLADECQARRAGRPWPRT